MVYMRAATAGPVTLPAPFVLTDMSPAIGRPPRRHYGYRFLQLRRHWNIVLRFLLLLFIPLFMSMFQYELDQSDDGNKSSNC